MGWGWGKQFYNMDGTPFYSIPGEVKIYQAIPQYDIKRVTYHYEMAYKPTEKQQVKLEQGYVNLALRENPGWKLGHFYSNIKCNSEFIPFTPQNPNWKGLREIPRYDFEIIIYLIKER